MFDIEHSPFSTSIDTRLKMVLDDGDDSEWLSAIIYYKQFEYGAFWSIRGEIE